MASPRPTLEVRQLTKRYPGMPAPAVDDISFSLAAGEIVGLLGPNGAGKSTTLGVLTTAHLASAGEIAIAGASVSADPVRARAAIGVIGQSNTLDSSCTAFENLYLHCRYHGLSRAAARRRAHVLLSRFGLEDKRDAKPAELSGGLAQRLQIARAIAHDPVLLLLDEPTNELDVPSQALFWEQIDLLRQAGDAAVLLATHVLEDAETHCDRVLIIDRGRIVLEGRPADLRARYRGAQAVELTLRRPLDATAQRTVEEMQSVVRCTIDRTLVTVLLESTELPLTALGRIAHPFGVNSIATRRASLREVFLEAVGAEAARA